MSSKRKPETTPPLKGTPPEEGNQSTLNSPPSEGWQAKPDGVVPKLRFPEFRDAGEWEERRLGELLLNHPDYGVNAPAVPYSEDLPAYLRITDISDEGYYLCDKKVSVDIEAKDENYLSEGDIVLARTGASVGKSYKYRKKDGKLVFAGFLIRIKPDPQKIDSTFLFNFVSTEQYWNWVGVNSARSGQPGINGNEYATLLVPVPPFEKEGVGLSEQQKIADCLSSIDDRITAETQKLDTLKVYKKGLMQQLFPAEGETLPKLRFPEFRYAPEWEEMQLDDIATIRSGTTPSRSKPEFHVNGSIPWVKTTDLNNSYIYTTEEKVTPLAKVKLNPEGSVLVAMYGGFNQIGRTGYLKITAATNQAISVLNVKKSKLTSLYLLIWLNAKITYWKKFAVSSRKDANITGSDVAAFSIALPRLPEQQKIADCVSSLDELIAAQTQKIDTLKAYKKGLMQQLFPALDEVKE